MSSARAPFPRRHTIVQRPESPNILPPRWSRRRITATAISSAALLVTSIAIGPADALLNLGRPTQIATPAATINAPIGDVGDLVKDVVRAPLPLLDPVLGRDPAAQPSPDDDPGTEPAPVRQAEPDPVRQPEPDPVRQPDPEPADDDDPKSATDDEPSPVRGVTPDPATPPGDQPGGPGPITPPKPVDPPKSILTPVPDPLTAAERQFFNFVNQERSRAGLSRLELDMRLVEKARLHSKRMSAANRPFHSVNLAALAPGKWRVIGENVGVSRSADALHARFMESASHKANILGHYDRLGVGVVVADGRLWVTEHFLATD
ncbi:MAG: CAP domain-containing protein [Actinomycetota bacterium]